MYHGTNKDNSEIAVAAVPSRRHCRKEIGKTTQSAHCTITECHTHVCACVTGLQHVQCADSVIMPRNCSTVNSGWYFKLEATAPLTATSRLTVCQRVIFSVRYGSYFNVTTHYLLAGWVYMTVAVKLRKTCNEKRGQILHFSHPCKIRQNL